MFTLPDTRTIVAAALAEDFGVDPSLFAEGAPVTGGLLDRDVTTRAALPPGASLATRIVARERIVVCGLPVVDKVYSTLVAAAGVTEPLEVFPLIAEGVLAEPGTAIAEVDGPAAAILGGERTALDFMMVLSGIATEARRWQEAAGDKLRVVDTRKTYPGLRSLSKYATHVGGATNHRRGLWDMVLIKDNHLHRTSIEDAVRNARDRDPGIAIEVEADTVEQAITAVVAGADLVLLDNMDDITLAEAVRAVRRTARDTHSAVLTEASGGITIDRIGALRRSGVDRVSTSAITFAPPRDVALDLVWTA